MSRLLLIDDNDAMREMMKDRLKDFYEVYDTGKPDEAIAMALQYKPDAVLLDLLMPGLSGFEVCQTLTNLTYTQHIPILIVSSEPASTYQNFCQNLGADAYFEKPVDFEQLKNRLNRILNSKRQERRTEARAKLNVVLRIRGKDKSGADVDLSTTTENVSAIGFLCGCTAELEKGTLVDVFLCGQSEQFAGRARVVRVEWRTSGCPRYGFCFIEKPRKWILG
jgi:DNA-binding response OmpR family regulator